jgi:hypothetical protein
MFSVLWDELLFFTTFMWSNCMAVHLLLLVQDPISRAEFISIGQYHQRNCSKFLSNIKCLTSQIFTKPNKNSFQAYIYGC